MPLVATQAVDRARFMAPMKLEVCIRHCAVLFATEAALVEERCS